MSAIEDWLKPHEAEGVAMIDAFCRIPSVSADPAFAQGIARCRRLRRRAPARGRASRWSSRSRPAAIPASWPNGSSDPALPTILVYGHYDVQPPDPLDKWRSPPFEPEIRDDRLYARGVSDDKGPLIVALHVLRGFGEVRRRAAAERQAADRGRGGIRQPAFRAHSRAAEGPAGLRPGGVGRWRDVARGPAIDDGGQPRAGRAGRRGRGRGEGPALGPPRRLGPEPDPGAGGDAGHAARCRRHRRRAGLCRRCDAARSGCARGDPAGGFRPRRLFRPDRRRIPTRCPRARIC